MLAALVREFGGPEALQIEEVAAPPCGADEILIDVQATAVNFVDSLVVAGTYQFLPPRPFVPGKLPAGVVREVGTSVTHLAPGDRVLTMAEQGGYATQAVGTAADACRLPDALSFTDAAGMALGFDTAWFALRERGRLREGETVLVLGATGSVGLAALQLARAFGARVLAGVSSPASGEAVRAAGAHEVIDLSVDDLHEGLRAQVRAVTGGQGADVVVDCLGDRFFGAALRALAWCGRLVVVGFAAGEIPSVRANYLLVKNIEVSGLQVSDYRKRMPQRMRACFQEVFDLYEQGRLKAPPIATVPLAEVATALRAVRDRTARQRLVLTP